MRALSYMVGAVVALLIMLVAPQYPMVIALFLPLALIAKALRRRPPTP